MEVKDVSVRIKRDGWCVVEGVIPASEVGSIRESIVKTVDFHEHSEPDEFGVTNPSRRGLINYDQSLAPYLANKYVMGITNELWGKWVKITITTPVFNRPGGKPQGWHADWPFNQTHPVAIKEPFPDTPMYLTMIYMLSDFTEENGATLLVPGSHRVLYDHDQETRMEPHPDQIQAVGPAGSALIFDSRMWHAVPLNKTDEIRVGVTVRYAPWWLNLNCIIPGRPEREFMTDSDGTKERNIQFPLPRKVFHALPKEVQDLFLHNVESSRQAH